MLLPTFSTADPHTGLAAILFGQERDMPHGLFGDRDAGARTGPQHRPAACGLFGRRGDTDTPEPADADDRATAERTGGRT